MQDILMHDGSLHFASLPESVPWSVLRDHLDSLADAKVTGFLSDEVTEVWIDFDFPSHSFSVNNQFGEYWFSVTDASCPSATLEQVI